MADFDQTTEFIFLTRAMMNEAEVVFSGNNTYLYFDAPGEQPFGLEILGYTRAEFDSSDFFPR